MFKKFTLVLLLSCFFIVNNVLPVFALATPSNANISTFAVDDPVQVTSALSVGGGYVDHKITSTVDTAFYFIPYSNMTSSKIHIFTYVDGNPEPRVEYSPEFFFDDGGFWQSNTSMLHTTYIIPMYIRSGGQILVRIYYSGTVPSNYYASVHYPRYKMDNFSGLYTKDDKKVSKNVDFRYWGDTVAPMIGLYQNVIYPTVNSCTVLAVRPNNSNGIYKAGYEYTIRFIHSFKPTSIYSVGAVLETSSYTLGDKYSYYTFTPRYDVPADDVYFALNATMNPRARYLGIDEITSTYIPVTESGQQGQAIASNTSIIKNVVTNISNTVSNISNQITNTTTTITNAVNNVADKVTGAVNNQTNTLTNNQNQNTNKVTQSQDKNADKITQSQKENTDKIVQNQKENTDKLNENQDKNTDKVTEKLEDVKKGIISGIIEGLKGLFIPSDDFFKTYFDDLFDWFSERLGFLSFPIDLLAEVVDMFTGSSSTDFVITLPSFEIMGESLMQEQSFNLTQFLNEHFKVVLDAIRLGVSVIIVFSFVHLCGRKWDEVMEN